MCRLYEKIRCKFGNIQKTSYLCISIMGLGKSKYALVKSSLVFVLVEGYRLVALKFYSI